MELDRYDKKNGRDGSNPVLQLLPHEAFDMMDADNDGLLDKLEFVSSLSIFLYFLPLNNF
jgi:hypothetical protein